MKYLVLIGVLIALMVYMYTVDGTSCTAKTIHECCETRGLLCFNEDDSLTDNFYRQKRQRIESEIQNHPRNRSNAKN
jgi:hypothetical protein